MPGPRVFGFATRLAYYEGAVRYAALNEAQQHNGANGRPSSQQPASGATPLVNVPGRGPSPLPPGATYTDGDRGSLMASPVFRDMIEFEKG